MKTINKLLELLDRFVDGISQVINSTMFLHHVSIILPIMGLFVMLLFTISAITGPGGITMRKSLVYVGIGISIIFVAIGAYMRAHLN